MGKFIDLKGKRFGRLTILKRVENGKWGHTRWLCECDCGNIIEVVGYYLITGHTQSCGCLRKEIVRVRSLKHGHAKPEAHTKTYQAWQNMLNRCNNPKAEGYKNWGGRGITVCERWNKFENFLQDMGEVPEGLTIDRKDNDGNYEPSNCKWATNKEQVRNNRHTKLNPLKVQVIKKLLKESQLKQWEIAEIFYVNKSTISFIKTGRTWGDITI